MSIWSGLWASAGKLALCAFQRRRAAERCISERRIVAGRCGGRQRQDHGRRHWGFFGTIEAVSGQLKTLIADPANAANDKDLAEQVAAIAADALIPDPIEREVALAIFDMIVSNMQSPSVTGANMASPIAPNGQRYFGR